jgi:hypothetical protein
MCPEAEEGRCCCNGEADIDVLFKHLETDDRRLLQALAIEYGLRADAAEWGDAPEGGAEPERILGDSGYIHPDAWRSAANIGELTDPKSTGRKRQARMYPIQKGQACEWAGKLIRLADLPEVVGCINSPATDLHHGPDKNTLNNEKVTWWEGPIGTHENTHLICSDCHNSLHAKHDAFYPEYDRVKQQAQPWMPSHVDYGFQYELVAAPLEQLMAEEARRAADRERRGKRTRGRQARTKEKGDTSVHDE